MFAYYCACLKRCAQHIYSSMRTNISLGCLFVEGKAVVEQVAHVFIVNLEIRHLHIVLSHTASSDSESERERERERDR
jgi:hypothetical protein